MADSAESAIGRDDAQSGSRSTQRPVVSAGSLDTTDHIDLTAIVDAAKYYKHLEDAAKRIVNTFSWRANGQDVPQVSSTDSIRLTNYESRPIPMDIEMQYGETDDFIPDDTPKKTSAEHIRKLDSHNTFIPDDTPKKTPAGHTNKMDRLRRLASLPPQKPRMLAATGGATEIRQLANVDDVLEELVRTLASMDMMQQERICGRTISFLLESPGRPDVVEIMSIEIEEVRALVSLVTDGAGLNTYLAADYRNLLARLLAKFGVVAHTVPAGISPQAPAGLDDIQRCLAAIQAETLRSTAARAFLDLLSSLLALSTMSYIGSHCADDSIPFLNIDASGATFGLSSIEIHARSGYGIRQRRLACLDDYMKGPVWVFGVSSAPQTQVKLLSSIEQFADLWGPMFAIPSIPGNFDQLIAVHLEHGFLHRDSNAQPIIVESRGRTSSTAFAETIFPMHFIRTGPIRRTVRPSDQDVVQNKLWVAVGNDRAVPERFLAFPSTARLLIGAVTGIQAEVAPAASLSLSSEGRCIDSVEQQPASADPTTAHHPHSSSLGAGNPPQARPDALANHQGHTLGTYRPKSLLQQFRQYPDAFRVVDVENASNVLAVLPNELVNDPAVVSTATRPLTVDLESRTLKTNRDCPYTLAEHGTIYALDLQVLGTAKRQYLPDEMQANFSGGQWVNVGMQKVWKLRPEISLKTTLVNICAKPRMAVHIRDVLETRVGLQWSACTGNAERVTLWDALKLAFTKSADQAILREAYDGHDNRVLAEYVADLEATGLDDQGYLRLFWPCSQGVPQVLEIKKGLPNWTKLLKDTKDSACFAMASEACLELNVEDSTLQTRQVSNGCAHGPNGNHDKPAKQALATVINVHHEDAPERRTRSRPAPLGLGVRIRLQCGEIEIRTASRVVTMDPRNRNGRNARHPWSSQLAYFTQAWQASHWIGKRLRRNSVKGVSRELLQYSSASSQLAPVFIMNSSVA